MQIKSHEQLLAKRIENFKKIRDNIASVEDRMKHLEKLHAGLHEQSQVLTHIKADLEGEPTAEIAVAQEAARPAAVTNAMAV